MISINQVKYLRSLNRKKFREEHGQYIVEGDKIVKEAIKEGVDIQRLFALKDWILNNNYPDELEIIEASAGDLQKISQLKTANNVIALINKKGEQDKFKIVENEWYIALDRLRDPGNMGTVIRTADWFGMKAVLMSNDCVEVYNPKVIQSCMGSLFRTQTIEVDLLSQVNFCRENNIPVYAAALSGTNLYELTNVKPGLIIFGNESNGISDELLNMATNLILIPGSGGAESLNVAVSAGIIMAWAVQFEN